MHEAVHSLQTKQVTTGTFTQKTEQFQEFWYYHILQLFICLTKVSKNCSHSCVKFQQRISTLSMYLCQNVIIISLSLWDSLSKMVMEYN